MKKILLTFFTAMLTLTAFGQHFYLGQDLSYVNQMEDCGAVFKEGGVEKDVFRIFADQGTNLVRVRLWVDPGWQHSLEQPAGVKAQYSDFEDVKQTIARAKAAGMQVLLGIHYSDVWADPGRQGSAQDHAVFFDPVNNNFMENGGGKWTNPHFYQDLSTVKATFKVDMKGVEADSGVYVAGDFDGAEWQIRPMLKEGYGIYSYYTYLKPGEQGAYHFLNDNDWAARETVPAECATMYETDRGYLIPDHDLTYQFPWASCGGEGAATARLKEDEAIFLVQEEKTANIRLYPNPSQGSVTLELPQFDHPVSLEVLDYTGKTILKMENRQPDLAGKLHIGLDSLKPGFYLLRASDDGRAFICFRFKKNP